MPSRGQVCACLVAGVLSVPGAAPAQERRPQDLVNLIVREGPRAVALRAGVEVVQREQAARRVFPNPSVSVSREGAGFTQFVQVEQALPVFGLRARLARAGVAASEAAVAERDAALWQLRSDAATAVTSWLAARQRSRLAENTVTAVTRLVDLVRQREREGEASRLDRVRVEQELAETRRTVVLATADAAVARAAVIALLPPTVVLGEVSGEVAPGPAPADFDRLRALARDGRADLRALDRAATHAGLEAEAAGPARFPVPVLSGGVKRAETLPGRTETGSVVGVGLSIPLFDTGRAEVGRWTAERERLATTRAALAHEVDAEIGGALEALRLKRAGLEALRADASPEDLLAMAETAYREGEAGVVALLDNVRAAARMRERDMEMRLEVRLAELALERAVGGVLWP